MLSPSAECTFVEINANTFGATELARLAKDLEFMAKENNLDIGNRLEVLNESFGKAADELKGMRV
jgi:hypothetical protein